MNPWKTRAIGAAAVSLMLAFSDAAVANEGSESPLYSFELDPANTALAPVGGMMASAGDSISVTGSGTFDPATRQIRGWGTFVHQNANGTVHCQGTWLATSFTSFVPFQRKRHGEVGGVLSFVVTHFCMTHGTTMTAIPMSVTSTVGAPAGSNYVEATTACDFTVPTGGKVEIERERSDRGP